MNQILNCTILVGLSYYDQNDCLIRQQQFLGTITDASEERGITVKTPSGENIIIPPDFESILDAPRGEYTCLSTGEVVVSPDLITSWSVQLPESPEADQDWRPNYAPFFHSLVPQEWTLTYAFDSDYLKRLIDTKSDHYVGKTILIGITRYSKNGEGEKTFLNQTQLYGNIVRVSYKEGIIINHGNNEEFSLPPDLSLIEPAPEGEYRLRATGDIVNDPDFITCFVIDIEKDA